MLENYSKWMVYTWFHTKRCIYRVWLKIYAKLSTLSTELAVNTVDRRVDLWITYGFVHNYVHRGGIRSRSGEKRKRIAREYSEICQKEKRKKFTYNVNFTGERKLQYLYKYNKCVDLAPETDCPSCTVCRRLWNTLYRRGNTIRLSARFIFYFLRKILLQAITPKKMMAVGIMMTNRNIHIYRGKEYIFTLDDMVSAL